MEFGVKQCHHGDERRSKERSLGVQGGLYAPIKNDEDAEIEG